MSNFWGAYHFIIALIMLISISSETFAMDTQKIQKISENDIITAIEDNFGGLFTNVIDFSEDYEIEKFTDNNGNIEDIQILDEVKISDVSLISKSNDISVLEQDYPAIHLPVSINNNIVMIFDIIKTDTGYSTSLGVDFAPLLNAVKQDGETSINILQDGFDLYALSNEKTYIQTGKSISSEESFSLINLNGFNDSADLNLKELYTSNVCNLDSTNYEYTQAAIQSINNEVNVSDSLQPLSTANPTGTRNLSGYPIVHQRIGSTQYGMCWAATVASMVRFEKPSTYGSLTAANVCDYMGIGYDDGGTNSEAKSALRHYLGSPYAPTIKSVLSTNDIYTVINNVDPAFMQCRRKSGAISYTYHAVALTGYSFTSTKTTIRIMDPAYECFKTCTYDGSKWTFAFGSYTYTWYKTIRLLYNS